MLEFQFGHCSIQTLSNASPGEYILHQSQYTTIYFTTALGDKWCDICFIFKPFRRACNLVYHEYEIHCLIPHGTPEETICKRLIIAVAQKVYDDYFLKNAGYKVALLETELQISCREVENQVGFIRASYRATSDGGLSSIFSTAPPQVLDKPTSTASKLVQPTSSPFTVWNLIGPTSDSVTTCKGDAQHASKRRKLDNNIDASSPLKLVQDSYKEAINSGKIQSSWLPRLESKSADHSIECWDPYVFKKQHLSYALLNTKKLDKILKDLKQTLNRVPIATKWTAMTQEHSLTPMDLHKILLLAFGYSDVSLTSQSSFNGDVPFILRLSMTFYQHADNIDVIQIPYRRASLLARLIGFALMRVYEVDSSATSSEVSCWMQKFFKGSVDRHKQSRNLACAWCWVMANLPQWRGRGLALYLMLVGTGENAFRNLSQPSFPVALGELVATLGKLPYLNHVPESIWVPDIIDIVIALLPTISLSTICHALAYRDSHLDTFKEGLDSMLFVTPSKVITLRELCRSQFILPCSDPEVRGTLSQRAGAPNNAKIGQSDERSGTNSRENTRPLSPVVDLDSDYHFDGSEFEKSGFFDPLLGLAGGAFNSEDRLNADGGLDL